MQLRSKVIILVLFVVACWFAQSYLFLGPGPTMTTEMALEQFKNNNVSAENLRVVDTSKNFLGVIAVFVFGFLLFFRELWGLLGLVTGESSCHHCGRRHEKSHEMGDV
jgi:hypothetical protein